MRERPVFMRSATKNVRARAEWRARVDARHRLNVRVCKNIFQRLTRAPRAEKNPRQSTSVAAKNFFRAARKKTQRMCDLRKIAQNSARMLHRDDARICLSETSDEKKYSSRAIARALVAANFFVRGACSIASETYQSFLAIAEKMLLHFRPTGMWEVLADAGSICGPAYRPSMAIKTKTRLRAGFFLSREKIACGQCSSLSINSA